MPIDREIQIRILTAVEKIAEDDGLDLHRKWFYNTAIALMITMIITIIIELLINC